MASILFGLLVSPRDNGEGRWVLGGNRMIRLTEIESVTRRDPETQKPTAAHFPFRRDVSVAILAHRSPPPDPCHHHPLTPYSKKIQLAHPPSWSPIFQVSIRHPRRRQLFNWKYFVLGKNRENIHKKKSKRVTLIYL